MMRPYVGSWKRLAVQGVAAVLFGLATLGALPTARTLAARFGATIHTVTGAISDFDLGRVRAEAAHALGTHPDDPRSHVEVDTDVTAAGHHYASQLGSCLVCLSTTGNYESPAP